MTLAEIIAEGRYVIEKWAPEGVVLREAMGVPIRVATLERLLAVAEAAVEMRRCMCDETTQSSNEYVDALAAFDAAARLPQPDGGERE